MDTAWTKWKISGFNAFWWRHGHTSFKRAGKRGRNMPLQMPCHVPRLPYQVQTICWGRKFMLCGKWIYAWMQQTQKVITRTFGRYKLQLKQIPNMYNWWIPYGMDFFYPSKLCQKICDRIGMDDSSYPLTEVWRWKVTEKLYLRQCDRQCSRICIKPTKEWPELRIGPGKWFIGLGWRRI